MRRYAICLSARGGFCIFDTADGSFVAERGRRVWLTTDANNYRTREAACSWIERHKTREDE